MWLFPSYWDEGTALADLPVVAPIVFPKYPQNAAEHLPLQIFFSAGFWLNAQRKQPKDIGWLRYTNVSCEVSGFLVHRVYGICTYGIHSFALCGFSHAEIADTFIPCSMQWPWEGTTYLWIFRCRAWDVVRMFGGKLFLLPHSLAGCTALSHSHPFYVDASWSWMLLLLLFYRVTIHCLMKLKSHTPKNCSEGGETTGGRWNLFSVWGGF